MVDTSGGNVVVSASAFGEFPERSNGADCKSVGYAFAGSNPALPISFAIQWRRGGFFFASYGMMAVMMQPPFWKRGLRFVCTQCSRCCRHDCVFWTDGGCSVYSARPLQCRTYPFWSHIVDSEEQWAREAAECPGIDIGPTHSGDDISAALRARRAAPPVHRPRDTGWRGE